MVKSIQTLNPAPWDNAGSNWVSSQTLDFSLDPLWKVTLVGNFQITPRNIAWNWVLIDNVENINPILITFGAQYRLTLPGGSRQSFPIPESVNIVSFLGISPEIVNVIFSERRISPDTDNLSVSIDRSNLLFPIVNVNSSQAQTSSQGQKKVRFNPGTDINYTLLSANTVPNGFIQFIDNISIGGNVYGNEGSIVSIVPSGADLINGWFNSGARPMMLYPGDSGILISDGVSQWSYQGKLSFKQILNDGNFSFAQIDHNFGRAPVGFLVTFSCRVAEHGYAIGDEILLGSIRSFDIGTSLPSPIEYGYWTGDKSSSVFRVFNTGGVPPIANLRILSITTGAYVALTQARWGIVQSCFTFW